jgi:hypothetical protein
VSATSTGARKAASTFRQRIGELAYAEHMRKVRDKRKRLGGPFRLDYVDSQGRSGSELATLAGKAGGRARSNKASKQEKK